MAEVRFTAPQMCDLTGMNVSRFKTLRRRAREQMDAEIVDVAEMEMLPLDDLEGGKWSRYSYLDVLRMACAVKLERLGASFRSATSIVINSGTWTENALPDLLIGKVIFADGSAKHFSGPVREVVGQLLAPKVVSAVMVDVGAVSQEVAAAAVAAGVDL